MYTNCSTASAQYSISFLYGLEDATRMFLLNHSRMYVVRTNITKHFMNPRVLPFRR